MFPDDFDYKLVMEFIAYCVQNEGDKIHYVLLIIGKQGTGKSYIGKTLSKIIGTQNVNSVETEELHTNFNSWLPHKSLIVIEELMDQGRIALGNKLKTMITEGSLRVNEKYVKPYEIDNKANFLSFTNHDKPIIIEDGDRRYCVIDSPVEPQDDEYYKILWPWTDNNLGVVLNHLLNWDLTHFNPKQKAPFTVAKGLLLKECEPEQLKEIRNKIRIGSSPFNSDIIALNDVSEYPYIDLPVTVKESENKLSGLFKKLGFVAYGQIRLEDNTRKRVWIIRDIEKWQDASEKEVLNEYNKGKP